MLVACSGEADPVVPSDSGVVPDTATDTPAPTDSGGSDSAAPEPGDFSDPITVGFDLTLEDPAELTDGVLFGDWLVLVGQHQQQLGGVWVYDASDREAPTPVGQTSIWNVQRVCAADDKLWGMDRGGNLLRIALASDGTPSIEQTWSRGSFGEGLDCTGDRVAWGNGSEGGGYSLDSDLSDPVSLDAEVRDVWWQGDTLWTLAHGRLDRWDLSGTPSIAASLELEGVCRDLAAGDDFVAIACGSTGVHLVDPSGPSLLGTWDGYASARSVDVVGDRVLVAGWTDLLWLDASDPTSPTLVATEPARTAMMGVVADTADHVYAVDWGEPYTAVLSASEAPEVRSSVTGVRTSDAVVLYNVGLAPLWLDEPSHGELAPRSVEPGGYALWTLPDTLDTGVSVATDDPDEPVFELPLSATEGVQPGDEAPPLSESDLYGALWELEALRGEVVFLGLFHDG